MTREDARASPISAPGETTPLVKGSSRTAAVSYRADVDGLRAFAVLIVLAYHLDGSWMPGGHSGVDMFFVISGFVVTGSLLKSDRTSVSHWTLGFYSRRYKRLTPALVVSVCCAAVALTVLSVPDREETDGHYVTGIAGLWGGANIYLAAHRASYFERSAGVGLEANPFMHLWSLGVEEQFYVCFPWLLLAVDGRACGAAAAPVAWVAGLGVLSAGLAGWLSTATPELVFFLLPWRAWQLLAGVLVALLVRDGSLGAHGVASATAVAANADASARGRRSAAQLLLQLAAASLLATSAAVGRTAGTVIPWGLLPVGGAVSFLLAGEGALAPPPWWSLNAALGLRLPVYVGKLSYPLYLWHWPVIVLWRQASGAGASHELPPLEALGLAALSLALAAGTYHSVEELARRWRPVNAWRVFAVALLALGGASALLVILRLVWERGAMCYQCSAAGSSPSLLEGPVSEQCIGTWNQTAFGTRLRLGGESAGGGGARSQCEATVACSNLPIDSKSSDEQLAAQLAACLTGSTVGQRASNRQRLLVVGDSHAHALFPGVYEEFCGEMDTALIYDNEIRWNDGKMSGEWCTFGRIDTDGQPCRCLNRTVGALQLVLRPGDIVVFHMFYGLGGTLTLERSIIALARIAAVHMVSLASCPHLRDVHMRSKLRAAPVAILRGGSPWQHRNLPRATCNHREAS